MKYSKTLISSIGLLAVSVVGCLPSVPAKMAHIESLTNRILTDDRMNSQDIKEKLNEHRTAFEGDPAYTPDFEFFLDYLKEQARNAFADEIAAKKEQMESELKSLNAILKVAVAKHDELRVVVTSTPALTGFVQRMPNPQWTDDQVTISTLRQAGDVWAAINKEKIPNFTTPLTLTDGYSHSEFADDTTELAEQYNSFNQVKRYHDELVKRRADAAARVVGPVDEWIAKRGGG
jgi:hypothetical protein